MVSVGSASAQIICFYNLFLIAQTYQITKCKARFTEVNGTGCSDAQKLLICIQKVQNTNAYGKKKGKKKKESEIK